MKTRKSVLCVVLTLGVLLFLSNCATTKTPLSTDNIDEMVGTWVNPENNYDKTGHHFGKMVFKPDKTADLYAYADSKKPGPGYGGSLDVKEKWMDRKGDCYLKTFLVVPWGQPHGLFKVNSDGNSLEMMFSWTVREEEGLPSEIDPTAAGPIEDPRYFIWYRQ